jgi:alpha-amylase/alpha-mannosidase (GH57 family)
VSATDLCLLWHMHQPDYRDPETGVARLPWVRLHAASSYRDMAAALAAADGVAVTVNFVPSLTAQLEALAGGASDLYEEIARKPAGELTPDERRFVLAGFFSVHHGRQLEPRPRYRELYQRVRAAGPARAAASLTAGDVTDLAVLFHLAWIGFAVRAEEPEVAELERKGAGFSEADKAWVLALVRAQVGRVLPAWRALAEAGRVELIASPFYHPIVPLLIDSEVARRAQPEAKLPPRFSFPEDARAHIERAQAAHARLFGARPRGMWPPEGSLSPEAVALYGDSGVEWLCGDEGVLWQSLSERDPAALAHPYQFGAVKLVFRDRDLSDRIGFAYAQSDADTAVADLCTRARAHHGLCGVFLDGENAWESYPERGRNFLEALYRGLAADPAIRACTLSQALADRPARPLERLHSGSWIDARFAIWIGDPEKNRAWACLERARRELTDSEPTREHLLVAEGSDWFWWFGEPFHSAEDATFDALFRARLRAAYHAAGREAPPELDAPIGRGAPVATTAPTRFLAPRIDGLITSYFEWDGAARWEVPRGAVMGESQPLLARILYGFDPSTLYLRLDPAAGMAALAGVEVELRLRAGARELRVRAPLDPVELPFCDELAPSPRPLGRGDGLARLEVIELAVRFATLGLEPGVRIDLVVQLARGGITLGRYPRDGYLDLTLPDATFEAKNWSA